MSQRNVICPAHDQYYITNICTLKSCLEPLCPECIPAHIKGHSLRGQLPQIENIQTVRIQQRAIVFDTLQKLGEQQFLLGNSNLEVYRAQAVQKLRDAQQEVYNVVNKTFDALEVELRKQFEGMTKLAVDDAQVQLIKQHVASMQSLHSDLDTGEYIKAILFSLDRGLNATTVAQVDRELAELHSMLPTVTLNENSLQSIRFGVEGYVSVKKQAPTMQKKVVQFQDQQVKLQDQAVVDQLLGQPINNSPYLKKDSFKAPKFLSNASELHEIESPFKPIQITATTRKDDLQMIISFYEDQKSVLYYVLPNFIEPENKQQVDVVQQTMQIERRIAVGSQCVTFKRDIYLIGGIERDIDRTQSISTVYKVNLKQRTLLHYNNMVHRRQGFGVCTTDLAIYVCGGSSSDTEGNSINTMERFDGNRWVPLKACSVGCTGLTLCNVRDEFIVKIGGRDRDFERVSMIEAYSIRQDFWFEVLVFDGTGRPWNGCPTNGGLIGINENELLMFGGEVDEHYSDNSWVLTMDVDSNMIRSSTIRRVHSLPMQGSVNAVKVHSNQVYTIVTRQEGVSLGGQHKRILCCGSEKWSYIQINE